MRAILIFMAVLFIVLGARSEERILYVYTWADYFDSEVIARFEKTHGCSVVLCFFDSNENLHNTLRRDGGSFDVLTPSSYMTRILYGEGFLADLDHDLLPNLRHLAPDPVDLGDDPDMRFSVPYARTVTGIGCNRSRVPEFAISAGSPMKELAHAFINHMLDPDTALRHEETAAKGRGGRARER